MGGCEDFVGVSVVLVGCVGGGSVVGVEFCVGGGIGCCWCDLCVVVVVVICGWWVVFIGWICGGVLLVFGWGCVVWVFVVVVGVFGERMGWGEVGGVDCVELFVLIVGVLLVGGGGVVLCDWDDGGDGDFGGEF